jgi:hypothetical protein
MYIYIRTNASTFAIKITNREKLRAQGCPARAIAVATERLEVRAWHPVSFASGCPSAAVEYHTGKVLIETARERTPPEEKVLVAESRKFPPTTEGRQIIPNQSRPQSEKSLIRNRRFNDPVPKSFTP